ncbi:MAG: peptidoglycan-binding protein [Verrucomicrobiota bacterium]|nr:peptidoglycan-binding protein [Verrucomicrobiota bacterium]
MKHSLFQFLIITLGLAIAAPVSPAQGRPLEKLHDLLLARDDKDRKDKDKDRRRDDDDRARRPHQHIDRDRNGNCDICPQIMYHQCVDRDRNGKCDICPKTMYRPHECYDRDYSGRCDYCGTTVVAIRRAPVYEARPGYDRRYSPARSIEADVQAALMRRGYYDGPADGTIGPGSRKAIEKFQDDYKLDVNGRIDRSLLRALGLEGR